MIRVPRCGLVWSGLKVSRSQSLKISRSQGLKVSRSQGGGGDGGDRGDGATSVTGLKVYVICEAVEVILRVK